MREFGIKTFDDLLGKEERDIAMLRPYCVFADADRIYVTDPGIPAVHIFEVVEKNYFQIKNFRGEALLSPIGIAADKSAIYLTDSMLKKVFVFDKKGNPLKEIGKPETFIRPTGIAIDEDRIYVADKNNKSVQVFQYLSEKYKKSQAAQPPK